MRNCFLIETAFTHRKFVFPPLEKNVQAHVAIATMLFGNSWTFLNVALRRFSYILSPYPITVVTI